MTTTMRRMSQQQPAKLSTNDDKGKTTTRDNWDNHYQDYRMNKAWCTCRQGGGKQQLAGQGRQWSNETTR
jgi:hypothetical protein